MQRADYIGALLLLAILGFQARTSFRVWKSQLFDRPQKSAQIKLIWLLPAIGALLVASVLEDEERRDKGSPPSLGR